MTPSQRSGIVIPRALIERADLLEQAAARKQEMRLNWRGMLADLGDYGRTGGSAADYRSIVEYLAALEESR
jgi:hypothetical protein